MSVNTSPGQVGEEAPETQRKRDEREQHTRRAPDNSWLYDRLMPIALALFGLLMLGMIIFAAAVILGAVRY